MSEEERDWMTKTAVQRLEILLNDKDHEIEKKDVRIEEFETTLRGVLTGWAVPVELPSDQSLPVPRLEMVFEELDSYNTRMVYRMVYRHLLGHCIGVPLGATTRSGYGKYDPIDNTDMAMPFRDGAHLRNEARQFGWPAFVVFEGRVKELNYD